MAFIKVPDEKKRRLYKFGTKSRETDALLFYIGNQVGCFRLNWTEAPVKYLVCRAVCSTNIHAIDIVFYVLQESFFCVFVERGYLMLQGQQAGRELRAQSAEKVSLFVR